MTVKRKQIRTSLDEQQKRQLQEEMEQLNPATPESTNNTTPAVPVAVPTTTAVEDKATFEVRLYLTAALDEKLDTLRQEFKRHTGRKIKPNEIMRKLIEQATLEDIL